MSDVRVRRLVSGDRQLARRLFTVMADVFEEECEPLSDEYLDRMLAQENFWAIAALTGDDIAGGLTAHTLPMTTSETFELFIYDIAVRSDFQRKGIGRLLMTTLLSAAAAKNINVVFVPADNDDAHALEFYRSLGGAPAPVTFFTFTRERESSSESASGR